MFQHEGPARTPRTNALLAGYLALIAGFVNSGGFVLIGTFTSHVTGSVGRFSFDLATADRAAALFALLLIFTFFAGAFSASLVIEGRRSQNIGRGYATALFAQALLLLWFVGVAGVSRTTHPRILDTEAAILSFAMGMQNSLVTKLSGATVRTTHLTGVLTDLGIETARWYRWYRYQFPGNTLGDGRTTPERPNPDRAALLITIIAAFATGASLGATLTLRWGHWAMLGPAGAVGIGSLLAYLQRPDREESPTAKGS